MMIMSVGYLETNLLEYMVHKFLFFML